MLKRRLINAMSAGIAVVALLSALAFGQSQPQQEQQPPPQQPQQPQEPPQQQQQPQQPSQPAQPATPQAPQQAPPQQPQQPLPPQPSPQAAPQQALPQAPVAPTAPAQPAQPAVALATLGPKKPGVLRIGVVLPITQISQDSGLAINEAVRQLLISYLNGPAAEAVPLDGRVPMQAELEAKQKECDFVFYSAVGRRQRSSGFAKFMRTATPVVGMIPGGAATTTAAGAAGAATTTDKVLKTATDLSGNIKASDEISVEFKLTTQGGATAKLANILKAKAKKDGDQVLATLLADAANAVLQAATQK